MTGSPSRLISFAAVLVAMSLGATAPALTQAPKPVTLHGIFDPINMELKPGETQNLELKPGAIDLLRDANKVQSTSNVGCYPPTVFTASVPKKLGEGHGSPGFMRGVGTSRVTVLKEALSGSLKLAPEQFDTTWAQGNSDDVQVTYGNGDEKEGPVLKVVWSPTKGAKVKVGQVITVTIIASEKFADGHKAWPTGIKTIQVRDEIKNILLMPVFEDHSPMPSPCEPRSLPPVEYKVKSEGPIVLRVIAENGVGLHTYDTATFSTSDWHGSIKAHVHGPSIYDDTAEIVFSFDEAQDGTLQGHAHAKMTNAPSQSSWSCVYTHTQEPSELDFEVGGHRVGNQFQLDIPTNLKAKIQFTLYACGGLPSPYTAPAPIDSNFFSAMAPPFYQRKVDARDGATDTLKAQTGVEITETTIELHQSIK